MTHSTNTLVLYLPGFNPVLAALDDADRDQTVSTEETGSYTYALLTNKDNL